MNLVSVKYESFDVNSNDAAFKYPNLELSFPCDIESVTIIAQSGGKAQSIVLNIDKEGKGWDAEKPEIGFRVSEEEIVADYFNGCCENNDFDEGLIRRMSLRYQISVAEIKAAIVSARFKYKKTDNERKDIERE